MLATLHLQLSPVDLLDDTLTTSATLLPDAGGEAESGFAHLLRVRVETTLQPAAESGQFTLQEGEILPPGGNPLPPAQALPTLSGSEPPPSITLIETGAGEDQQRPIELPVPTEAAVSEGVPGRLPTSQPTLQPVTAEEHEDGTELPGEIADISLASPVIYPPQNHLPAEPMDFTDSPLPTPAATPVQVQRAAVEAPADGLDESTGGRSRPLSPAVPQLTRPELAARAQDTSAMAREPVELAAASVGLRDRGQRLTPATKPLPTSPVPLPNETRAETSRAELQKRLDLAPPPRAESMRENVTEIAQPRAATPQPLQSPHLQAAAQPAQPSQVTQPSQPIIAAAPATVTSADASYSPAAQQSTDLIATPVRDASWGQQISERVLLMAGKNLNAAEIRLTPAELGPLRVRVSIDDGAANVTFHVNHVVTREAIEQAMPRLREMLAENGLTLGQADVAEQGVAERDRNNQANGRLSEEATDEARESATVDETGLAPNRRNQSGLVDTFA